MPIHNRYSGVGPYKKLAGVDDDESRRMYDAAVYEVTRGSMRPEKGRETRFAGEVRANNMSRAYDQGAYRRVENDRLRSLLPDANLTEAQKQAMRANGISPGGGMPAPVKDPMSDLLKVYGNSDRAKQVAMQHLQRTMEPTAWNDWMRIHGPNYQTQPTPPQMPTAPGFGRNETGYSPWRQHRQDFSDYYSMFGGGL